MNTKLDINKRRRAFSANVVTLLVGVVAVLFLGGSSVQAQTTTSTTDATAAETTAPPSGNNTAAVVNSSITIKTNGTVTEGTTTVKLAGDVTVKCKKVLDTTLTTAVPLVLLDFDFSQLTGTTGSGKTLKTFVTGGNHATELRPFQASDTIVVTVPYFDSATDGSQASSFMATATLTFDTTTGTLTGGTLTYGSNTFKTTGVGTFTVAQ